MELIRSEHSMRELSARARSRGLRVGLVPTMGSLHDGHLHLVRAARETADVSVVSIFVNPAQFGSESDLESYPRDLTRDADLCIQEDVDYLFHPEAAEIYPPGDVTRVDPGRVGEVLEGASRPGHFRGVATVVLKLIEIVRPHVAAFGEKDAQQLAVVRRMVQDLLLGVEILAVPIVRDDDGVALSSRNRHLSSEDRTRAQALSRALEAARYVLEEGQNDVEELKSAAREVLEGEEGVAPDYVEIIDEATFETVDRLGAATRLVLAAEVGGIRLLDNAELRDPSSVQQRPVAARS
ncbi:MAG: pantoate--beta-alanine ligase [Acidobacteriota bacterium]|nr:pantoate--beta-alanine ligase [Acidobacteriota bacterium]MDH3784909.1 pantoate--beta-alanine ligase [Acidobacteriota bacterium]